MLMFLPAELTISLELQTLQSALSVPSFSPTILCYEKTSQHHQACYCKILLLLVSNSQFLPWLIFATFARKQSYAQDI